MNTPLANIQTRIDGYVNETRKSIGCEVKGRVGWNWRITQEASRHFAFGIGDDHPRWVDESYGASSLYEGNLAPPAFLASVMYPVLHGASIPVPLTDLIGKLSYQWYLPLRVGDEVKAKIFLRDVEEIKDRGGRRVVNVHSETKYWNQRGQLLAEARSIMARPHREQNELLLEREPTRYTEDELANIKNLYEAEWKRRGQWETADAFTENETLPEVVRGPLTIGDMVCWQAGAGPSYRAGYLGYQDVMHAPHTATVNPVTGWPVKKSLQHEDFLMAADRGMPAPFDNGVMRFATVSTVVSNLLPDEALLAELDVQVLQANLYGDCTFFNTRVMSVTEKENGHRVRLKLEGKNQLGEMTTTAVAELDYPKVTHPWSPFIPKKELHEDPVNLFQQKVAESPQRIALCEGETSFSFQEVDEWTNRMAHWLMDQGTAPGDFVGVFYPRGCLNTCLLLAILKAGAVFVPMDPGFSVERVEDVLEFLPLSKLITSTELSALVRKSLVPCLLIDENLPFFDSFSKEQPAVKVEPDALAYIMHTSGSVGKPKSVAGRRSALVSYVKACGKALPEVETYLHTATTSFSAATRQTFLPLLSGKTTVIATENERNNPMRLAELIREKHVNVWDTVPSILQVFLDQAGAVGSADPGIGALPSLKYVFTTGQALPWNLVSRWHQEADQQARIVNLYSQTETAGTVCAFLTDPDRLEPEGTVPIGYPFEDAPVRVCDEKGQEVSPGEAGEIWVGGERLTEGYLTFPELSRSRFISQVSEAGKRLLFYKTGDLGVLRDDGALMHKGRADDKIKVRGIGLEIGAMEKEVESLPGIAQAAVVARENEALDYDLHVFLIRKADDLSEEEIEANLRSSLPSHMAPTTLTFLEEMPLGSSGKRDKSKLPVPERVSVEKTDVLEGDTFEEQMCSLWAQLLDLQDVKADDNFFDLGGHSLKAAELCGRVKKSFDYDLDIPEIVEFPTPGLLCSSIRSKRDGVETTAMPATVVKMRDGTRSPVFCVPGVGGHLMRHQLLPVYLSEDLPVYGIQASIQSPLFQNQDLSIEHIAEGFNQVMKTIQPEGPYDIIGTCFGGVIAFEMARQLQVNNDEVRSLVLVETRAPDRLLPGYVPKLEALERLYGRLSGSSKPVKKTLEEKHAEEDRNARVHNAPNMEFKLRLRKARKDYLPGEFKGNLQLLKVEESDYRIRLFDRRRFWAKIVKGNFTETWIPGNHLSMLEEPHVQVLGREASKIFSKSERRNG